VPILLRRLKVNTFAFFVCAVLPYLAVIAFLAGMTYRFYIWFRTSQPGKMTLFPAGDSTLRSILSETFLFPSLFKGDKTLWAFSWLFHATLALVVLGHFRVFTGLIDSILMALGMTPEGIAGMSGTLGGAAGIVLLATGLLLLIRRLVVPRVREISNLPDFIAPLLLIAILCTGNLMRFGPHFDLEQTRLWASSLLFFSPVVLTDKAFLVHAFLAMLLFIYIPYSKILHFGGIFFTQALVKRR
jgi:nitrate reductase gamma subunit